LDVGCGNGNYVGEMEKLGWEAYGLEMNPDVARYAEEHLKLRIFAGHLPDPRFKTGFFDVVTMWDSFEHMANPCAVLAGIHRLLAPGGQLIFSTPNFNSIYRRFFGSKWFNVTAPLHYYYYTFENISRLLSKNGFRMTKVRYPLGAAGLIQTLQILLTGKLDEDGSFKNRLIRTVFKWPHRISPRGHLMVFATPEV
jgi:2-polyprenyl-3-methyl-5-hydroxy-6-metoxy-1,4-benzoquinol methylase